jgi:hypothetical protein
MTRDPIVFDRRRILRKVRKLLARNLKSKLANNEGLETTNEGNATDLYGLELYWWKVETVDQVQVKAEWNRYQYQYQNPQQMISNTENRHYNLNG